MIRSRRRVRTVAARSVLLAVLVVASSVVGPLAGMAAAETGTGTEPATWGVASAGATTSHDGVHVEFTSSLTPERPGEIGVDARFTIPEGVTSLTAEVPEGVTVTNADGFSQRGPRQYEWTRTTNQPSLSYRLPVNETVSRGREGTETSGYIFVDTGEWAVTKVPRLGVTYSGTGQRQPLRTDQSVGGEGVAGESLLFLGPVDTETREVAGQRITLAVPEAADLRDSRADVLDALAATARTTTLGAADDEVLAIAAPTKGIEYGSTGLQRGPSEFWVRDVQRLDTPENVWDHEYVHTRQTYRPTTETRWTYEGMADYYAASRALRSGRINYSQFHRHLNIGTRQRYSDVVLAEQDTWSGTTAHYWKGALVFAAIDRQIRVETGGRAMLQDAVRRAQDRTDGGRLNQSTFLDSVEAVGGGESREVARRYTETDATPEPPNRSEYARVFGGLADFDYRFDGFRVEGPYRNATVDRLPTLVPGERVVVRATAANTGDAAGEFAITLRRDDRAVGTRTGELDAGTTTGLSWTVPFDAATETSLRLGEATRDVTVRPPATPSVTELEAPGRADVGEAVTVRALVTNRAGRPAEGTVALTADGETVAERRLRLAPGASATLAGTVTLDAPGEYAVAADSRTTTVTVRDPTPTRTVAERGGPGDESGTATPSAAGNGGGDRGPDGGGTDTDADPSADADASTDAAGTASSTATTGTATTGTATTPSGAPGDGFGAVAALLAAVLVAIGVGRRR